MNTDNYSDDEKLIYLIDCIKDPAAQAFVSASIANGDNYSTVVDRLRKRMDNPREAYHRALKTFLSFGAVEYDKAGLSYCGQPPHEPTYAREVWGWVYWINTHRDCRT